MKKNLLYLFALICSMSLFTACNNDDDESVSQFVGTYSMAEYTAKTFMDGETEMKNYPVSGPIYAEWNAEPKDAFTEAMAATFKLMGGAVLPQVLNTITLESDGNIRASYIDKPTIEFDPSWATSGFMAGTFPETSLIKGLAATGGWTNSPAGLAQWSEKNGKFYVKLDIAAIITASAGAGSDELAKMINQILNSKPSEIKTLLGVALGADLSELSDNSISMLLDWVKNGIPMNVKAEGNRTVLYLDKATFDPLLKKPSVDGKCDLQILWDAMTGANLIPEEAQMAGLMIMFLEMYWDKTTTFNIGLDLIKE